MAMVDVFYTATGENKPAAERVHHRHTDCLTAQRMALPNRRPGTGMDRLCDVCNRLSLEERRGSPGNPRSAGRRATG